MFRKDVFNRNFMLARFSFSLYLWNANWWEPGSGTIWKLRMRWVWIRPPIVWHIGAISSIVPRRKKTFPLFLSFCGPINYFSAFHFQNHFLAFQSISHMKHVLFSLLEVFILTKNRSKRINFFPKNSLNLTPISSLIIFPIYACQTTVAYFLKSEEFYQNLSHFSLLFLCHLWNSSCRTDHIFRVLQNALDREET